MGVFKRSFVVVMFFMHSLFAYVTSTQGGLNQTNTLKYTQDKYIKVTQTKIENNFGFLINPEYKPTITYKIQKKQCIDEDTGEVSQCDKKIPVYHIAYKDLFSFISYNDFENGFTFLLDNKPAKIIKKDTDIENIIFGSVSVTEYIVTKQGKKVFVVDYHDALPLRFVINQHRFDLILIDNKYVEKFNHLKSTLKTVLDNFDFTKEPIWAKYIVNTKEGVRYLDAKFKMENKKDNIFSVNLSSSGLVLDPRKQQDLPYKIKTYLIDLNNFLFEYQTILNIDSKNVLLWRQLPKSVKVPLIYIDENGKQRKKFIFRGSKPMYDFGGVWYLVSWCDIHNIKNMPISYITTGRVEGKVTKISNNSYNVKAFIGDDILKNWTFTLDQYHRIIKVKDNKYDLVIKLKTPFMNKTIQDNIKKLNSYKSAHNLREVQ